MKTIFDNLRDMEKYNQYMDFKMLLLKFLIAGMMIAIIAGLLKG